jgi:DNA repair protein RecN (Recombination protein N)
MLRHLSIKNFAIIEDIVIDFKDGMNVLIGETGAGKSIIIDALSLLKGEKSLFDKIRNGETKALIEGEFEIQDQKLVSEINEEFDDIIEDNLLLVSRSLDISNKSVAKINYKTVPLSVLKRVMEKIIDIHSQHKNNAYFIDEKQITFIDEYLLKTRKDDFNLALNAYKNAYLAYLEEVKKLEKLKSWKESIDDIDYLQYQYDELTKANIQENEIEEVEAELKTLESFEEFSSLMKQFDDLYNNASGDLYSAKKVISNLKNEQFDAQVERFVQTYYEMEDVHEEIMSLFNKTAGNLDKLDYLKSRKSLFASLKRKYGSTTKEILDKYQEIKSQIDLLGDYEYNIASQEKLIKEKEAEASLKGDELRTLRKDASILLQNQVNEQIHDLLLENADFMISLEDKKLQEDGKDKITFMIKANAGGKYLPISESASLGETSRINLAIKNVFNHLNPVETIIFDEIDTGISGRVAIATGKKIHDISKESQALVISHLPQVASCGDHHFFVKKEVIDGETKSSIRELSLKEVTEEIAKLITGETTNESIKIAKSLIKEANN